MSICGIAQSVRLSATSMIRLRNVFYLPQMYKRICSHIFPGGGLVNKTSVCTEVKQKKKWMLSCCNRATTYKKSSFCVGLNWNNVVKFDFDIIKITISLLSDSKLVPHSRHQLSLLCFTASFAVGGAFLRSAERRWYDLMLAFGVRLQYNVVRIKRKYGSL